MKPKTPEEKLGS